MNSLVPALFPQLAITVRHVRAILPKNSRSPRFLRLDMSSLLLHNRTADVSTLYLQLTDIRVTSGHSADAQSPLLRLTNASVVANIRETLDVKITVAPIEVQLDTAQCVYKLMLVFHVSQAYVKPTFALPTRCTLLSELQENLLEAPQLVNNDLVLFESETSAFSADVQQPRIVSHVRLSVTMDGIELRYNRARPEEELEPFAKLSVGSLDATLTTAETDNFVSEFTLNLGSVMIEDLRYLPQAASFEIAARP